MANLYSKLDPQLEKFVRQRDKNLKMLFSGKIKGSLLIEIKNRVVEKIAPKFAQYFYCDVTQAKIVSNSFDLAIDFEICKIIVGIHQSNLVFANDEQTRSNLQKNENYKQKLVDTAVAHIKMRHYGSEFFRAKHVRELDQFLYYPLPYDLFVMGVRLYNLVTKHTNDPLFYIFDAIAEKGLSALTLLESNLFDDAYPLCRGTVEMYARLILLKAYPNVMERYQQLTDMELNYSQLNTPYPPEFQQLYCNKKANTTKANYLHFGWLDEIADYHQIVKQKPYSVEGIFEYVCTKWPEVNDVYSLVLKEYKKCHAYTHGYVLHKYPVVHYFELTTMLYLTIASTYEHFCDRHNYKTVVGEVDVLNKTIDDFSLMASQYSICTNKNIDAYYKNQK